MLLSNKIVHMSIHTLPAFVYATGSTRNVLNDDKLDLLVIEPRLSKSKFNLVQEMVFISEVETHIEHESGHEPRAIIQDHGEYQDKKSISYLHKSDGKSIERVS